MPRNQGAIVRAFGCLLQAATVCDASAIERADTCRHFAAADAVTAGKMSHELGSLPQLLARPACLTLEIKQRPWIDEGLVVQIRLLYDRARIGFTHHRDHLGSAIRSAYCGNVV